MKIIACHLEIVAPDERLMFMAMQWVSLRTTRIAWRAVWGAERRGFAE